MGTLLRIEKNGEYKTKEFNSYYLAVVEKNKLMKKGVKATLIDTKIDVRDDCTINRDSVLRTVYNYTDRQKLRQLTQKYEPQIFSHKETQWTK